MSLKSVGLRLRALFLRWRAEEELDEELRTHIELQTKKYIANGLNAEEAKRRALLEFGGRESAKEACRDIARWEFLESAVRNTKFALRSLRKSPGFAATTVLILAMTIGPAVAVFALINALLLKPLPVSHPEELIRISSVDKQGQLQELPSTILEVLRHQRPFTELCGFDTSYIPAEIGGVIHSVGMEGFSGGCFQTLGIKTQLGRPLTTADDNAWAERVAVLTDDSWRTQFGSRRDVLGEKVRIDQQIFTVVGVTEKSFKGLLLGFPPQFLLPLLQEAPPPSHGRNPHPWVNVFARVKGTSTKQAQVQITTMREHLLEASALQRFNPAQQEAYLSQRLVVTSARTGLDYMLRDRFGAPLYAVLGICVSVLLIACVSIANLLLARGLHRGREFTVRVALGAQLRHVAGLIVVEGWLLLFAGSTLGVLLAFWINQVLLSKVAGAFSDFSFSASMDWRNAAFGLLILASLLFVFGWIALWQTSRLSEMDALREGGRTLAVRTAAARRALITAQIALTLAFVTGTALFVASLHRLYGIPLGIETRNVWNAMLFPRPGVRSSSLLPSYFQGLLNQVQALPGIKSVAFSDDMPLFTRPYQESVTLAEQGTLGEGWRARVNWASDTYLQTLGIKLVRGKNFPSEGSHAGEAVAIVSQSLAEELGASGVIGSYVRVGSDTGYQHLRVIGIAADAELSLQNLADSRQPTIYIDWWQHPEVHGYPVLLIRTAANAVPAEQLRRLLNRGGREYMEHLASLNTAKENSLLTERLLAYVSSAFGVMALVMAAAGLFGLLSYQVASRYRELGIRVALGAQRVQIQWLVLREVLLLFVIGSVAGVGLSLAVARAIVGLLFGVHGFSVSALAISTGVLALTAMGAAWIPARRAASVDPAVALRHE